MSLWETLVSSKYPNTGQIPGPLPEFPLGNIRDLRGHSALEMSEMLKRTYGPYAIVWIANQPTVWLHDPDAILEVLSTKSSSFFKDEPLAAMRPGLGAPNAFTSNGAEWKETHRNSFLEDLRMPAWLVNQFEPARAFLIARFDRDLPIVDKPDLESWIYRLVFDLTSHMLLGRGVGDEAFDAYNRVTDALDVRMSTNLPLLPRGFARNKKKWFDAVADAASAAREEPSGTSMAHQLARYSRLLQHEQAGALGNMFPGGVFSVTATLLHLLTQADVLSDLGAAIPKAPSGYSDVVACVRLEQWIRESMRVAPPVPVFMRRVSAAPVEVGRFTLDPGVRVIIGTAPLHRDASHWPDPLAFKPDRWTEATLAENPFGSGYLFPFGRGPRTCQGQDVALFQIRMVMLMLLERSVQCAPPTSHRFYFGCAMPQGVRGTIR